MLYDILPIFVIIASLGVIIFILAKKMPKVASVDTKKIPAEVQGEIKKNLLERKIDRTLTGFGDKVKPARDKVFETLRGRLDKFKEAVSGLEEKQKEKDKESIKEEPEVLNKEIDSLLGRAVSLVDKEEFSEAEKKYLEIISLDERNIVAYAGLGELYYKKKELEGAKEVMEYVLKLADNDYGELEASDYVLLALIYRDLKDYKKALNTIRRAVELEPKSPKNLDLLCKISIISKNRKEAEEALERLSKVNPDNEKVREYRQEIKKMSA
ncbi:tetratricopeptide repeat protein [Candidatus Falkowbacteria bacterium]|nr:tetratricopeptide repeat protein [Candidatus Falkowbacteria bacterium]